MRCLVFLYPVLSWVRTQKPMGVVEKLENCRQTRRKEWADMGGPLQQKMGRHQIQSS